MNNYKHPRGWDRFSEYADPEGIAFDMDRALWCWLWDMDESLHGANVAADASGDRALVAMASTVRFDRDHLIAQLDRAWGFK